MISKFSLQGHLASLLWTCAEAEPYDRECDGAKLFTSWWSRRKKRETDTQTETERQTHREREAARVPIIL
jgi:hypothetical protein